MQAEPILAAPPVDSNAPTISSALTLQSAPGPVAEDEAVPVPSVLRRLPVQLDVRIPVPSFQVRELLSLEKGRVIETTWAHSEDLPLWAGGVQLVWSEFEIVGQKLGIRVTRLI